MLMARFLAVVLVATLAARCGSAPVATLHKAPQASGKAAPKAASSGVAGEVHKVPETFGQLETIGDALYINFSSGREGDEDLIRVWEDLPRCLQEGASSKERHGWKLSNRDARAQKKRRRMGRAREAAREGHDMHLGFVGPMGAGLLPRAVPLGVCAPPGRGLPLGRSLMGGGRGGGVLLPGGAFWRGEAPPPIVALRAGLAAADDSKGNQTRASKGFGGKGSGGGGKGDKPDRGVSAMRKAGGVREVDMVFTCNKCETRQTKRFTRDAYEKGVVIVVCEGCEAKHLIADNLGWYKDWTDGVGTNIVDIMRSKGVQVDNRLSPYYNPEAADASSQPPIVMRESEDGTLQMVVENNE